MSNDLAKYLNSRRRFKTDVAIARQVKIAKSRGSFPDNHSLIKESHRLAKHHAMDCGRPGCAMCGNPRHIHKDKLTAQEKRLYQDLDRVIDKNGNGSPSDIDQSND